MFLLSCATDIQTRRWMLADVLAAAATSTTEQELLAKIGSPHGIERFNPGTRSDPYSLNWIRRGEWSKHLVTYPEFLISELSVGTKILVYDFGYSTSLSGGALLVYVSNSGKVSGYSYSKTLVGLEKKARMHRRRKSEMYRNEGNGQLLIPTGPNQQLVPTPETTRHVSWYTGGGRGTSARYASNIGMSCNLLP